MKIIVVNDPHLSDRSPSTRRDNYRETALNKLRFCVDTVINEKAHALIIPGDLYHRKIPSHNSHSLIRETINILSPIGDKVFAVAGNHDISGTLSNLDRQPISVLEEAGSLRLLENKTFLLEENDLSVSVSGKHFNSKLDKKTSGSMYNLDHMEADLNIGVFHQMIIPNGQTFFDDFINFEDLAEINSDIIYVGHYHVGFTPTAVNLYDKYFVNSGSLTRGSSDQFNLEKEPLITLTEITKIDGKVSVTNRDIVVPHEDSKEVFDMRAVERKRENKVMKEFIDNLSEFEAESLTSETPEGIIKILQTMGMEDDLKDLANKYLYEVYERMG